MSPVQAGLSKKRIEPTPPERSPQPLHPPDRSTSTPTASPPASGASTGSDQSPAPGSTAPVGQVATASPIRQECLAIKRELESEILRAVGSGYAAGIVDVDDPACTHPVSDKGFRDIVAGFNRAMADIRTRFPRMRRFEPPRLSRQDPFTGPGNPLDARYQPQLRSLCFREFADFAEWEHSGAGLHARQLAPANGFAGVVAKQLGHHLSCPAVVHPRVWAPPLRAVLNANLHLANEGEGTIWKLHSERPLPHWVSKLARMAPNDTGVGKALGEFAAGSIAWRLHPDYGRTPEVPRMPDYLADWLHESFPFLDAGQHPEPSSPGESSRQGAGVFPSGTDLPRTRTGPVPTSASPQPARDALERPLAQAAPNCLNVPVALEAEKQWAVLNGYVKGIFDRDHPRCTHPVSDIGFWQILFRFNRAMSDFHARFPGLRDIEPPLLLRSYPSLSRRRDANACYSPSARALCFREVDDLKLRNFDGTHSRAPRLGFGGLVAHGYGNHLSHVAVPWSIWMPKLTEALRVNGCWSPESGPRTLDYSPHTVFSIQVGRRARELGIGIYAGSSPLEFAAEAIAWRLHSDYAASPYAPRMPRFLENWVHECFPFLDNGSIPDRFIEFDPGKLKMPILRNGKIQWIPRRELPPAGATAPAGQEVRAADSRD